MKQFIIAVVILQLLRSATTFNVGVAELQGSDGHDEDSPIEEGWLVEPLRHMRCDI